MVKEWALRCGCVEVRVQIGRRDRREPCLFQRYRIASRERTTELREALLRRVTGAVKD